MASTKPTGTEQAAQQGPQQQQAPQQPQQQETAKEDIWEVNKPVERRCRALTEEQNDCLGCLWRWMTCGGPGGRVRQLYVNGRLNRCLDEYARLKNCLLGKLDEEKRVTYLPGPHPLWQIRTRKQAEAFWSEQYAFLGAGQRQQQQQGSSSSSEETGAAEGSSSRTSNATIT